MRIIITASAFFIAVSVFGQTKKELVKISKAQIEFIDRGIDYSRVFVPYCAEGYFSTKVSLWESTIRNALFSCGLEVGAYYEEEIVHDGNNLERKISTNITVQGDYLVEIKRGGGYIVLFEFIDIKNDNKLVGILSVQGSGSNLS
jgi:hypothetical protein